jgi:hypothetical protein
MLYGGIKDYRELGMYSIDAVLAIGDFREQADSTL